MSWLKSKVAHCPHLCTQMRTMGSFLTVFFFLLLNFEVRHSCFSLQAKLFSLIATVSTRSHYLNLWHSEEKCNFRINGEFLYIYAETENQMLWWSKIPTLRMMILSRRCSFLKRYFPHWKKIYLFISLSDSSLSLLCLLLLLIWNVLWD